MKRTYYLVWLTGIALELAITACASRPPLAPSAHPATESPAAAATITATPAATRAPTAVIGDAAPVLLPSPTATAVAAIAADEDGAEADEEECRKACHAIDINSLFGLGAKHQPTNHRSYTVCLECHAVLAGPALPPTHLGRQDPACPLCHLSK